MNKELIYKSIIFGLTRMFYFALGWLACYYTYIKS